MTSLPARAREGRRVRAKSGLISGKQLGFSDYELTIKPTKALRSVQAR